MGELILAHIEKRESKDGILSYRVQVRMKGYPTQTATFNRITDAKKWAAQTEVATFLERAEFGEDVREDMADIIETHQRRGQNITLQDAYKKACLMNDNVRSVLSQRAKARGAQQTTTAAQKARSAAVQVSGSAPMGALRQESTDVRSAIEAAITMTTR